jgi:putative molybdopterin biosynthesis protein
LEEKSFLSTREVARFLDVNEKMVYTLVSEKGLPATKVTGKWLFPRRLVEDWLENHIVNHPGAVVRGPRASTLLLAGSNDVLLDRTLALFNRLNPDNPALFGNVGSLNGLKALARGQCHAAPSHLLQEDESEYNFDFAREIFRGEPPAVVNFCRREQGLVIAAGNPSGIGGVADLGRPGIRIANRPRGTGTRLLLDRELGKAGIQGPQVQGYEREFRSHLDVALEVLAGRADAAPAIRAVSGLLELDFIPLRWERYDLLSSRDLFFEQPLQRFLALLGDPAFRAIGAGLRGYDLSLCGKMVFPE